MLVCVYPLEVVRTRLTANQARHKKDADFNGVLDCMRKTVKQVHTDFAQRLEREAGFGPCYRFLPIMMELFKRTVDSHQAMVVICMFFARY
jgi:mannose/fructose/N-acetylgalactosamine-specific phosphotransferase system component IID